MTKKINWYAGRTANNPADIQEICIQIAGATEPQNLADVIKGSDGVVVDVAEDDQSLEVHLDNATQNKINNSLQVPSQAPSAAQLVAVGTNKAQTMLSVGDGLSVENGSLKASKKLYRHNIFVNGKFKFTTSIINEDDTPFTTSSFIDYIFQQYSITVRTLAASGVYYGNPHSYSNIIGINGAEDEINIMCAVSEIYLTTDNEVTVLEPVMGNYRLSKYLFSAAEFYDHVTEI